LTMKKMPVFLYYAGKINFKQRGHYAIVISKS
jgi:hypothetical protein